MAGMLNFDTDTIAKVKMTYPVLEEENANLIKGIDLYIEALSGTGSKVVEDQLDIVREKREAFVKVVKDLEEPMDRLFSVLGNLDEFGNGGN